MLEPKYLDVLRIIVQRLERKLFQQAGLPCKPNEEGVVAGGFLSKMLELAATAGGDPPLPEKPDTQHLQEIRGLSGNEQLVALYDSRDRLSQAWNEWNHRASLIQTRQPRWDTLNRLLSHARGLSVFEEITPQVDAIKKQRLLLSEPDPIPDLCERLTTVLRQTLLEAYES